MVREEAMYGTGFLPGDEASLYKTREDDLYLVGTSEVPLAAFHMGEILDEAELPRRYSGYSTCFRREAGTYGKDMGGMFRVHQFDKLEMFSFTTPEESWDEHERLVAIEEEIVSNLALPYRVVNIAVGDLGAPAAKKYDIEVWLPGQDRYRELTSCSNCTDYQARRLQTRVRRADDTIEVLHTLNGTATAIGRTFDRAARERSARGRIGGVARGAVAVAPGIGARTHAEALRLRVNGARNGCVVSLARKRGPR